MSTPQMEQGTETQAPPPLSALWAIGVFAVCTLVLGYPALRGQFLLTEYSDQYIAGYAFREFARSYFMQHGAIPQWNPYLFGGMPFVDAMHGDTFYPTALLRILIGTDRGMTWGLLLHVFLAGCFSYAFLRSLGLSFAAALVGGVAYQMGGNFAGLVSPGHDGKMFVATMLPLALWAVVRGVRDNKRSAWGILAIAVGLGVLSPHPQLLQYMLLVTGAFALCLAMGWLGDTPIPRPIGLRRLATALSMVGVGLLIGAIQYWPVLHYVSWSPRSGGKGWEHAVSYSMPPEEIVNFWLPQFSGILRNYWGRNIIHLHSEYIGISVLVLAGLAFGAWARRSEKRLVTFWSVTFVIALLWALGGFTPFYKLVYAIVPGTKYFRAPSTMLYVVSFSAAVLCAFGTERVVRGTMSRSYGIAAAIAALLVGILGISGGWTNMAQSLADPSRFEVVAAGAPYLSAGSLRAMLFALLAVAAAALVARRKLPRDLAMMVPAIVVAFDLWTVVKDYWQFKPPASVTFASDPIIDYLKKQPVPTRVFAADLAGTALNRDPIVGGQFGYAGLMAHGIPVTLGYHGNHIGKHDLLSGGEEQGYNSLGNPNFWRLSNMQYIFTTTTEPPISGMTKVLGPVRTAAGSQAYLYRLPGEVSYAWVAPIIVKAEEKTAAATALNPGFDVTRAAIFDTSAKVKGEEPKALPPATGVAATVTHWEAGRASITLDKPAPAGSALVVSENYYPGWTATADGKPVEVARADAALIGIPLPTGATKVELAFVSQTYNTGRAITWVALALALLLIVWGSVVDRREVARG